jgi:hypothetical protein
MADSGRARTPNGAPQNLQKRIAASHTPWHLSHVTVDGAGDGDGATCNTAAGDTGTAAGLSADVAGAEAVPPWPPAASGAPHETQNLPLSGFRVWHRPQTTSCTLVSGIVGANGCLAGAATGAGARAPPSVARIAGMPAGGVGGTTRRCSCRRRPQS